MKILKFSLLTFFLTTNLYTSVFAEGFATDKNKYDFSIEYDGDFSDNSAGSRNKVYSNYIEIDNEIGISQHSSLGFDVFLSKNHTRSDDANNISSDKGTWSQSFQFAHKLSYSLQNGIDVGMKNVLGSFDNGDTTYSARYELRGMIRKKFAEGFLKEGRFEVSYRKRFNKELTDGVRFDIRTKFRLNSNIDYLIRVLPYMQFASGTWLEENPNKVNQVNKYNFKIKDYRINYTDLYTGPEFKGNNYTIFVYYHQKVQGSDSTLQNHMKGFVVGYSTTFDL